MSGETIQAAQGRWQGILTQLAGVEQGTLDGKHRPCPYCGGDDRFRFDDKDGSGSWICNQCGAGYGIDLLMRLTGWDFKQAAQEVDKIVGTIQAAKSKPKTDPRQRLRKIAQGAKKLTGEDPASRYLKNRGVVASPEIRWHQKLNYYEDGKRVGAYPAMLSLVRDAKGAPLTYHVTYLAGDGRKADVPSPKKVLPHDGKLSGGGVRLFQPGGSLVLAEGIETALAAASEFQEPAWSTISASGMEAIVLPDTIRSVLIVGDNDKSFTGQRAAYDLASRLKGEGRAVDIYIPPTTGNDLLDEIHKHAQGAA